MGEVSYSVDLANATRRMLDDVEMKYEFEQDRGLFIFSMGLGEDQKLQKIRIIIRIHDNAITSYAQVNMKADSDSISAVVEYITRANFGLRLGNFEVDYDDGEVRYKCHNRFEDRIPSEDELKSIAIACPLQMWMRYGNGFLKVLFGGVNPKDAIAEAEGE